MIGWIKSRDSMHPHNGVFSGGKTPPGFFDARFFHSLGETDLFHGTYILFKKTNVVIVKIKKNMKLPI